MRVLDPGDPRIFALPFPTRPQPPSPRTTSSAAGSPGGPRLAPASLVQANAAQPKKSAGSSPPTPARSAQHGTSAYHGATHAHPTTALTGMTHRSGGTVAIPSHVSMVNPTGPAALNPTGPSKVNPLLAELRAEMKANARLPAGGSGRRDELRRALKWLGLQAAAVGGSVSYSTYFASRAAYRAAAHIPGGFIVQPLLAEIERGGLRGDMALDRLEQLLGDPRGQYDEGPQPVGTFPVTHWGPALNLPGAHRNKRLDLDPVVPDVVTGLPK
jgi:hypothetical protein